MKLIGAGFGRTGTMSLRGALERLGAGPCVHMIDLIRDQDLAQRWADGLAEQPHNWHKIMADHEATVDWPGCSYYEEMMAAFPDANVLLNLRDADAWYKSMYNTVYSIRKAYSEGVALGPGTEPEVSPTAWQVVGGTVWSSIDYDRFEDRDYVISVFHEHNQRVRETVPADRLLEFTIGDGWEPLADFLGVPVPDEEFPHINDTAFFRNMVGLAQEGAS